MSWQKLVEGRQEVVLASASKNGEAHAIIVISLGRIDEKILIGACLMKKTLSNIRANNKIVLIVRNNGEYYRINGTATIHTDDSYFDYVYKISNPPMPKSALAVNIHEVFDLDKQTTVFKKDA
jgi:predicted pyridoxine 5'-phosphate oxidase superfamily flavin-nucleotide-binding protein